MGADTLLSSEQEADIVSAVRRETEGARGADAVIECVGRPDVWEQAIAMARKAGTVNLFGGCPADTRITLDTGRIHYDELTLKGAFHHTPAAIREALRLIAEGAVRPTDLIQQRAPLTDLPVVLRSLASGHAAPKFAIYPAVK